MEITIGRNPESIIPIAPQYKDVSWDHAIIKMDKEGTLSILDLDSKNGTYLRDRAIASAPISYGDRLRLGTSYVVGEQFWDEVKAHLAQHKTDYSEEYQKVLAHFKTYHDKKEKLYKTPLAPILIRVSVVVCALTIITFHPEILPNPNWRYLIYIGAGLLATVFATVFNNNQSKRNNALQSLLVEYENILVCPKCNTKLLSGQKEYVYWKAQDQCPNTHCDAKYKKSC